MVHLQFHTLLYGWSLSYVIFLLFLYNYSTSMNNFYVSSEDWISLKILCKFQILPQSTDRKIPKISLSELCEMESSVVVDAASHCIASTVSTLVGG